MQKYNKDLKCPKCGFTTTYQSKWKLSFEDSCNNFGYNKCDWDGDNTEHLHQECPDCGYTLPVACLDSEEVAANTWSTTTPVQEQTRGSMGMMKTAPVVTAPATVVRPVTPIFQSSTPVKCRTCPVDAAEA